MPLSQDPQKIEARVKKLAQRVRPLIRLCNGGLRYIDTESIDVMETDITCFPEVKYHKGRVRGLEVLTCVRTYHKIRSSATFFQPTVVGTLWSARQHVGRAMFNKARAFEIITTGVQICEGTHEAITVLYR
jgi:hypothetical protein